MQQGSARPDIFVAPQSAAPGQGYLQVTRVGDRSVVSRAYATSPLRWLTPRNHGHAAWVFSSTFGGGLVDGDALGMRIDVEAGATAFLSTQASTKIYRSPRGTHSHLQATVQEQGCLVLAPDPVVPFGGAHYAQTQDIDLAAGASLVLIDWMSSGRVAHGERWKFEACRTRLRIRQNGALICHDAVTLRADDGPLVDRMSGFDVLATLVLAGPLVAAVAERLIADSAGIAPEKRADLLMVAARMGASGALVRLTGVSVEQVGRALRELLRFLPFALGDNPWARKW